MFEIRKNIAKPADLKVRGSTATKYPLEQMEVLDVFIVPKEDMQEGDDTAKFRNRVQKSVRNFVLRTKTDTLRREYTVAVMTEDDSGDTPQYLAGDVGVWRDK